MRYLVCHDLRKVAIKKKGDWTSQLFKTTLILVLVKGQCERIQPLCSEDLSRGLNMASVKNG